MIDAPDWAVTCDDVPRKVHARDDGHTCGNPVVAVMDYHGNMMPRTRAVKLVARAGKLKAKTYAEHSREDVHRRDWKCR